eukprot:COSAG05_NODE_16503_length_344_cov_1.485714_1_plen_53_part_01
MQSALNPLGLGLPVHICRNIVALSGVRVLSPPITSGIERTTYAAGITLEPQLV